MENIFIEFLPPWIETGLQPAFYDKESGTVLQQTARMYAKVNEVVESVNHQNEAIDEYIEKFNELHDYVYDYFDNLDVQQEIDNKLDEMYANGQLDLLFSKYVNDYVEATNLRITELDSKVNSLNDLAPTVVSSTSAMTDHEKIYLNTGDGYWYYWNGSAFVQGGLYNSDATDTAIKWYLNDVASDGNNLINPFTAVVGALKSADGSYDSTNTNYWVTDFIPFDFSHIEHTSDNINDYWLMGGFIKDNNPVAWYKVCVYDSNQELVFTQNGNGHFYWQFSYTDHPDLSGWAYIRFQFANTDVTYANRYHVQYSQPIVGENHTAQQLYQNSRFTSIDTDGIKSGGIDNSRLAENIYINNIYEMFKNNINPFNLTDFGYGTIETANGRTTTNRRRINLCKIINIPSGTSINLSNNWDFLAFSYDENDNYLGRFYQNWGQSIYFPTDMRIRMVFKNDVINYIDDSDSIKNLISNISIEHKDSGFEYVGEKIVLKPKYGVVPTGLKNKGQDSACYGDNYITFGSTGYYEMYTMNGDLLKSSTGLDQVATIAPHANSVCFGTEKYDDGDTYPLLYVNAYNNTVLPTGACYVYRLLNNMTTSLQQTILIDFTNEPIWAGDGSSVRPYGNFIVDTDNNKLYAYVMIDSLNVTRFFKFDLPSLSDGATVRLTEDDIEEYFDVAWMYYIQGVTYYNNKIYATCGFTTDDCKLYVVDLTEKKVTSVAPLGGFVGEPESAFVYKDTLYISSTSKFFKLQF